MSQITILVPTDFSPSATEALKQASYLAQSIDAKLLILHVHANPELPGADEFDLADPIEKELQEQLKAIRPASLHVPCEHRLARGRPSEVILRLIDRENIAQVVMGLHGQTNAPAAVMGSVAQAVSSRCQKSILLVQHAG